jgi:Alcohol dehydrogenase GroES-like domain
VRAKHGVLQRNLLFVAQPIFLIPRLSRPLLAFQPQCSWRAPRLTHDFREATRVVAQALPAPLPPGHVLIRNVYAGVNASDVNFSSGRYQASRAEAEAQLPFDAGFEAVGVVAAAAPDVTGALESRFTNFFVFFCGLMSRVR